MKYVPTSSRIRVISISSEMIIELLETVPDFASGIVRVVENPLPEDARVVRCEVDNNNVIRLVIQSDTFDEVLPGDEIPRHPSPVFCRSAAVKE